MVLLQNWLYSKSFFINMGKHGLAKAGSFIFDLTSFFKSVISDSDGVLAEPRLGMIEACGG